MTNVGVENKAFRISMTSNLQLCTPRELALSYAFVNANDELITLQTHVKDNIKTCLQYVKDILKTYTRHVRLYCMTY
jgi:hypothetical protein